MIPQELQNQPGARPLCLDRCIAKDQSIHNSAPEIILSIAAPEKDLPAKLLNQLLYRARKNSIICRISTEKMPMGGGVMHYKEK